MALISDLLLFLAAVSCAVYCIILSRRLYRFRDLEDGVGGAVAVLAVQVEDLQKTLTAAQSTSKASVCELEEQNDRADAACRRLELLMASLHDIDRPERSRSVRRIRKSQSSEAA